jgi:hypothetical protein
MNVGGMWAPCLLFCVVHVNVLINFVCLFFMMHLVTWKMIAVEDFLLICLLTLFVYSS